MFLVGPSDSPPHFGQGQGQRLRSRTRKFRNRFVAITPLYTARFTSSTNRNIPVPAAGICLMCLALPIFLIYQFCLSVHCIPVFYGYGLGRIHRISSPHIILVLLISKFSRNFDGVNPCGGTK